MNANERQVGGGHYKVGGEEHWDRVARLGLDYFQGQITKYVERHKKKGGIEDLRKAAHFLEKYIELQSHNSSEFSSALEGLWTCRRCGEVIYAETSAQAFEKHGECAGACYVDQG